MFHVLLLDRAAHGARVAVTCIDEQRLAGGGLDEDRVALADIENEHLEGTGAGWVVPPAV